MKVFISWSGQRSRAVAEALREWVPLVLHFVNPWLSESDVEAGDRWGDAVAKELELSNFGVTCITRENVDAPWVLFEAGALAKSVQSGRLIPLLLDHEFRDITGPLAQFQAKKVDKSGMEEVIRSINQAAGPESDTSDRVHQRFEGLWPSFEERIQAIPEDETSTRHSRPQSEVLEDLVSSVRSLDLRMREFPDFSPGMSRRYRRFHPMFFEELLGDTEGPGDPLWLLFLASAFRDSIPGLYELGLEAYHATLSGPPDTAERMSLRFLRAAELALHGPMRPEDTGLDPGLVMMLMHEVERRPTRRRRPKVIQGDESPDASEKGEHDESDG